MNIIIVNLRTYIKLLLVLLTTYTLSLTPAFCEVKIHPNAGTTSATFLKLGLGSRAIGMGEAFSALSDDITALYWNPAGLVQLDGNQMHITHNESFEGIKHEFFGYAAPLKKGTLALGVYGITIPKDLERRSGLFEGNPFEPLTVSEGTFGAYDAAVHVSYAKELKDNLSGGASFKIIQQNIDNFSAYGLAADFGTLYKFPEQPLSLAFVLENIGTKIKFLNEGYYPPFTVRAGSAYRWNKSLVSTLDLAKPIDNFVFVSAGAEYTPVDFLAIRTGYKYRWYGEELDDLSGLSAGLGINFMISSVNFRFDYAFTPYGVLGNSQRFSLTSFFGNSKKKEKKTEIAVNETPKPDLNKEPKIYSSPADSSKVEGFVFFPAQVSVVLKTTVGPMSIYKIDIESKECDVYLVRGILRGFGTNKLKFEIGEKPGKDDIYKHYYFNGSLNIPVQKVDCEIRLPVKLGNVVLKTYGDAVIELKKISEDQAYIKYAFALDTLEPFYIEKNLVTPNADKVEIDTNSLNIAILDFQAMPPVSLAVSTSVTESFRYLLSETKLYTLVDRNSMEKILTEQGFQQTGSTTTERAVQIGKLLNVSKIISGSFGKLGQDYLLALNIINVQTGEIIYSEQVACKELTPDELKKLTETLVQNVNAHIKQ
ncbi:MAG: PorV/PorQ family protein [Elusimicrobia bacterium]|nr:PorV/PorQ family protein [Candidatus Liberimonas magnetica]